MSQMGQNRRFDPRAITSALPSATDLREMRERVRSVPRTVKERSRYRVLPWASPHFFRAIALMSVDEAVAKLEWLTTAIDTAIKTII
jgi:hypothetical protein